MGKSKLPAPPHKKVPPGIEDGNAFENYALYLSMGIEERIAVFKVEKGTDENFAAKFKMNRWTLWSWKQDDALWKLRDGHLKALKQFTGPVLRALARKAMARGDAYEVETWMRLVENYQPNNKTTVEAGEGLAELLKKELYGPEKPKDETPETDQG